MLRVVYISKFLVSECSLKAIITYKNVFMRGTYAVHKETELLK